MHADEGRIHRSAGHHRIARLAECARRERQRWHESAEMDDLFQWNDHPAAIAQIVRDGIIQSRMGLRVAENPMVHPLVQRLKNHRSRRKIHIRDPERIKLGAAVILDAAGPAAGDLGVEIEIHGSPLFVATRETIKSDLEDRVDSLAQ